MTLYRRVQKCPSIRVALALLVALMGALPLFQICISEHHESHVFLAVSGCHAEGPAEPVHGNPFHREGPEVGRHRDSRGSDGCVDLALSQEFYSDGAPGPTHSSPAVAGLPVRATDDAANGGARWTGLAGRPSSAQRLLDPSESGFRLLI